MRVKSREQHNDPGHVPDLKRSIHKLTRLSFGFSVSREYIRTTIQCFVLLATLNALRNEQNCEPYNICYKHKETRRLLAVCFSLHITKEVWGGGSLRPEGIGARLLFAFIYGDKRLTCQTQRENANYKQSTRPFSFYYAISKEQREPGIRQAVSGSWMVAQAQCTPS